jgi:hypothetical protein
MMTAKMTMMMMMMMVMVMIMMMIIDKAFLNQMHLWQMFRI